MSRRDIDAFEVMMMRENCDIGFFVSFAYSSDAMTEIDQYQVSTDKRSGITNDPNREDEPDYIVKLIGKVITVSLETQKLIAALPALKTAGTTPEI